MKDIKLKIKIIIPIIACLIVAVLGFFQGYSFDKLAYTMIAVAFIFYVLGMIIHYYLAKAITKEIEEKKAIENAQKEAKKKEAEDIEAEEKDKKGKVLTEKKEEELEQ